MTEDNIFVQIYEILLRAYGSQSWWPAATPFEVMVGAVLTQNTSWTNVEKAIAGLRETCQLTPEGILSLSLDQLETAIRPSGYFRQKAVRLRTLCHFIVENYKDDLSLTERSSTQELRRQFLDLKGIGPETADSILLYALDRPVFVVDAYTVRFFSRLGLCDEKVKYADVQNLFMDGLEHNARMFNEYHALIVRHAKARCRKKEPECGGCVLAGMCAFNLRSHISYLRSVVSG